MCKTVKPMLSLKQFMLRQQVLKLYRDIFRTIRHIPEESNRQQMKDWARSDFRANMHHTEELTIKMLMQHGQRSLNELRSSLALSGTMQSSDAATKPK